MSAGHVNELLDAAASLLNSRRGQYMLAAGLALCLPAVRTALNRALFRPMALLLLKDELKRTLGAKELQDRLRKWNEAGWKATYRVLIVATALVVALDEGFLFTPSAFWAGCNQFPPCNFPHISRGLRLVFSLELAFYLDAVPFLLFFEVRRKGFLADLVHHIVTLGLIFYASQLNFLKVGVAIILCHEVNDILMEAAKMWRYLGYALIPHLLFVAFALTWLLTRLLYFPVFVIWNIYTEPPKLAKLYGIELWPHREIYLALLCTLLALHVYWSALIGRIIYNTVSGRAELDDVREDPTVAAGKRAAGKAE